MSHFERLASVVALALVAAACGSSPTAPGEDSVSVLSAPENGGGVSYSGANRGTPPLVCGIESIHLSAAPSINRQAKEVKAGFTGDARYCPGPTWSAFPASKMSVSKNDPTTVVVYDNPANKLGWVDVTATVLVGTSRMGQTLRIQFPRLANQ